MFGSLTSSRAFRRQIDYYRIGVKGAISSLGLQNVEDLCYYGYTAYCGQNAIITANGVNQGPGNPGAANTPGQLQSVISQAFNAASYLTDGFDLEASYQFDLQDYDVPGTFTFNSNINHTSKFISDSGIPGSQRNIELAGYLGGGGNSQTYNQSGGNVLTWKLEETESYQNDIWGIHVTERWYAGGTFENKNYVVCAPGTCPVPTIQSPTINYDAVELDHVSGRRHRLERQRQDPALHPD